MADPNNITLRSEKGSFLSYEEADLNFLELQNLIQEHNIVSTSVSDLDLELSQYKTTTNDAITQLQNAGGLTYEGDYNPAFTYTNGQVVTFTDGLDYISVADANTNNTPGTDTNFWITLTSKSLAEFVAYDNTSGLTATDVQAAIDELVEDLEQVNSATNTRIDNLINDGVESTTSTWSSLKIRAEFDNYQAATDVPTLSTTTVTVNELTQTSVTITSYNKYVQYEATIADPSVAGVSIDGSQIIIQTKDIGANQSTTINVTAKTPGILVSEPETIALDVIYVPTVADDVIQIVDFMGESQVNTGWELV